MLRDLSDEIALWDRLLAIPGSKPREQGKILGINPKRVVSICYKWARKGWYDYGIAPDLGWTNLDGHIGFSRFREQYFKERRSNGLP